ncbi:MAG: ABC transporter ATP-binding protein [Bacteroidales bacterium]|nr:ABC transporter ATP-binding protein [Bacteroidales bacterium]
MRYVGVDKENILLEVKNLSVAFGGRTVVENVSYTLQRGRTLGIVGESGSGKSVSTLALMGLLPKQAKVTGSALLEGTELLTLDEEGFRGIRGRRISMIFQEPMTSLNPVQKCGAQVLEMMASRKDEESKSQKERVIELFKEVLLPRPEKIFDSYPHEISGGQKQRVMIAMALINHPDIIIADEPTTALDVTVQKTILELLKSLQSKYGTSIIFITHDLGVISQIADDILVMYRGKAMEQGPADKILHTPQEPYTQGLLACRPPLDSRPRRLPTVEEYLSGDRKEEDGQQPDTSAPISTPRTPLIEVRNLSVTYTLKKSLFGRPLQTLKGVDGASFDIMEGETMGLVGESGCGKSTLGRALLRLIDHSDGSISYRGRTLDTLSAKEMRALRPKLQIIFQDPYSSLNPRITIGEAIAEPLRVHKGERLKVNCGRRPCGAKGERELVLELMEQVGLQADWYNRYPHELSGGQRQRVCIARALILQPELVVCDESVSALDVSVQSQVLNLLNDLKEQYRFTYLFITHDLSVVHYMADRIMVMQKGKIVESGTPDDLFHHPQTAYTRTLLEAIPRIN